MIATYFGMLFCFGKRKAPVVWFKRISQKNLSAVLFYFPNLILNQES
jgi:hypothetical protein